MGNSWSIIKITKSPLSNSIVTLSSIDLFRVPMRDSRFKFSLFSGNSSPFVVIFLHSGKGIKEIVRPK